jgi:hypothetical protein
MLPQFKIRLRQILERDENLPYNPSALGMDLGPAIAMESTVISIA